MTRRLGGGILAAALLILAPACANWRGEESSSSLQAGKKLKRVVLRDGKKCIEERVIRDTRLPYRYDAWVKQFQLTVKAKIEAGVSADSQVQVLREVSKRVELLTNMRSELAKDWNAFAISEETYERRTETIDNSILALQAIVGQEGNAELSRTVLAHIAEWSQRPPPQSIEKEKRLRLRVWMMGQRRLSRGIVEAPVHDGAVLRSGDQFRVIAEPSKDAYVYLIVYDAQRRATVYFPSPSVSMNNQVFKDQRRQIPGGDVWFTLDNNAGVETIFVLASETRLDEIDRLARDIQDAGQASLATLSEMYSRGATIVDDGTAPRTMVSHLDNGREIRQVAALVEGHATAVHCITIQHQ